MAPVPVASGDRTGAEMTDARLLELLDEVGLPAPVDGAVTIEGQDPIVATAFPVGEAAALALAACGVAVRTALGASRRAAAAGAGQRAACRGLPPQPLHPAAERRTRPALARGGQPTGGLLPLPRRALGPPARRPPESGGRHDEGARLRQRTRVRRRRGGPLGRPGARERAGRGAPVRRDAPHRRGVGRAPPGPGARRCAAGRDRQARRLRPGAAAGRRPAAVRACGCST